MINIFECGSSYPLNTDVCNINGHAIILPHEWSERAQSVLHKLDAVNATAQELEIPSLDDNSCSPIVCI